MKKTIYLLILLLVVVSGLVFSFAPFAYGSDANREIKNETQRSPKPLPVGERKPVLDERKKWESDGQDVEHDKIVASLCPGPPHGG